ncbi:MAG: hypothetical protein HY664_04145 [Chloroflexi bacterium]|nr:hypothetical protein [Chloroflexota bacterium]
MPQLYLKPGESKSSADRERYWKQGNRIQAYDEFGDLRFDKVVTWEELKANNFRVVIVEKVPATQS